MIAMCAFFWLTTEIMQDQMTFPIKSFFFFLIDLEFPTDLRLVVLGAVAVLFLVALRIPAVLLSTRGMDLRRKEFRFPVAALASGLAAGPLATLPLHRGIPGMENLAPGIYAVIVFSVIIFATGSRIVGRMRDWQEMIASVKGSLAFAICGTGIRPAWMGPGTQLPSLDFDKHCPVSYQSSREPAPQESDSEFAREPECY